MKPSKLKWRCAAVAAFASLAIGAALVPAANAADHGAAIERQDWSFAGFTGQYDRAQLQRGFQVFQQVCTACHGLKRVRFRNLAEPGGPQFPEEAVKALAAQWPYQISGELDDEGNPVDRVPGLADPIIGPYKNDVQARAAQNGALPPDLSLIVKARSVESHAPWYSQWFHMLVDVVTGYQEGGADYLYALMTGYRDPPPAGVEVNPGMYYNVAFPGHQLAMPPPMSKDAVTEYQPEAGVKATLEQNAHDLTAFLAWASDPSLDDRKRLGWQVMLYLLITTVLLYLVKKKIWSRLKH
ncbi:MAG TPA: cytochrome c1 [Hyphomicrobium sp.]|nr:cytochrome c1 [Hyphomicrobium sp.]